MTVTAKGTHRARRVPQLEKSAVRLATLSVFLETHVQVKHNFAGSVVLTDAGRCCACDPSRAVCAAALAGRLLVGIFGWMLAFAECGEIVSSGRGKPALPWPGLPGG